jgi:hypothetical protein
LISWSCGPVIEKQQKSIHTYYDIDGLVEEQLLMLDSINPSLFKTATINGVQEKTVFTPTDSIWRKELEIFRSADINKPRLINSYLQTEENSENDSSITYISKFPKSTLADTIRVVFKNDLPEQIYASLRSQNTLFKTSKKLTLSFKGFQGQPVLSDFSILGWQKMISKDSTHFDIQGRINLP